MLSVYFVDATHGDDSWDGLSGAYVSGTNGPWRTIERVNNSSSVAQTTTVIMDATHLNGSFSSPDVAGKVDGARPTGWSVSGYPSGFVAGLNDGGVDAGQYFYYTNPFSSVASYVSRENIYTIVAAGETITMSYYIGSPGGTYSAAKAKGTMRLGVYGSYNYYENGYSSCGQVLVGDRSGQIVVKFGAYGVAHGLRKAANCISLHPSRTIDTIRAGGFLSQRGI